MFVPERNVLSLFFLLEEGDEKWPHFLHDIRREWIARWIQIVGGAVHSYDHLNSSYTLAYPSLEDYLKGSKQTEVKVSLSAIYTTQKIYFRKQSNLHRYNEQIKCPTGIRRERPLYQRSPRQ